jgi:hypothetical protein
MDAPHALRLVQPLLDSFQNLTHRRADKAECDDLLLAINALPLGVFAGRGSDLERLWMQALSCLRYAVLLRLYGDASAAREESDKAKWKIEQIRVRTGEEAWPSPAAAILSEPCSLA